MRFKLVALDMDGTLLNNEHQISDENKKVINNLIEQGIEVVLASGRPFESIYPYTLELGTDSPIISTNGAFIKDPNTNKVIYSVGLRFDYAKEIIQYGKENDYKISLYTNQGVLTFNEEMLELHRSLEKICAQFIDEYVENNTLYKIIYADTPERISSAYHTIHGRYKEDLYVTRSDDKFLDVMNINASKGNALKHLMEEMGYSKEEVLVIGNSYNDIAMFEVAGLAVAMENSPQKVKNSAHYVTKTNDQHGVAYALDKFART